MISFEDYARKYGSLFIEEDGMAAPAAAAAAAAPAAAGGDQQSLAQSEHQMAQSLFDQRVAPMLQRLSNAAALEQFWGLVTNAVLQHPKMSDTIRARIQQKKGETALSGVGLQSQQPASTNGPV